jgi:hypothetical protein
VPGTYGVTAADVAAELPGLFVVGFTQATKPSEAMITAWIGDADAFIDTVVTQVVAVNADLADAAARLARRYVLNDVIARVYRAVYAGKASPADIAALTASVDGKTILGQLQALATSEIAAQLAKLEESALGGPKIGVSTTGLPTRALLISDDDLDAGPVSTSGDLGQEESPFRRRGRF